MHVQHPKENKIKERTPAFQKRRQFKVAPALDHHPLSEGYCISGPFAQPGFG
jgi:hypothetical protein